VPSSAPTAQRASQPIPQVEYRYGPIASSPWSKVAGPAIVHGFHRWFCPVVAATVCKEPSTSTPPTNGLLSCSICVVRVVRILYFNNLARHQNFPKQSISPHPFRPPRCLYIWPGTANPISLDTDHPDDVLLAQGFLGTFVSNISHNDGETAERYCLWSLDHSVCCTTRSEYGRLHSSTSCSTTALFH